MLKMKKEEATNKAKEIIIKNLGTKNFTYNPTLFDLILKSVLEFGEWQNSQNNESKIQEEIVSKAIEYSVNNPGEFVNTPYFEQVGGLYNQTDIEWAFEEGGKWMHKTMLKRACKWLKKNTSNYQNWEYNEFHNCVEYDGSMDIEKMISEFKKAMKE